MAFSSDLLKRSLSSLESCSLQNSPEKDQDSFQQVLSTCEFEYSHSHWNLNKSSL